MGSAIWLAIFPSSRMRTTQQLADLPYLVAAKPLWTACDGPTLDRWIANLGS